jgi:hypothetical protein
MPIGLGRNAPVRGGAADVTLRCLENAVCAGQLLLQGARLPGALQASRDRGATVVAAGKTTSYGHASFRIRAGGHKVVKVTLSRAGRALLAHHHTVMVWAIVKFSGTGGKSYEAKLKLHG